MRHIGDYKLASVTWQKLLGVAFSKGLRPSSMQIGVVYDDPTITPVDQIRYDACLVTSFEEMEALGLSSAEALAHGIRIERLEASLAWRTTHIGSYRTLAQAYAGASAPEEFAVLGVHGPAPHPPYYEVYRSDPSSSPPDEQVTDVYLPISEELAAADAE
jgi:AraC family transcriptional regulator